MLSATAPTSRRVELDDVVATLGAFQHGRGDPTTRISPHDFWRATLTPLGAATIHIVWSGGTLDAEAWGPGREWILERVAAMAGADDEGFDCPHDCHIAIARAHRNHGSLRLGKSGTLYHELLPTILEQRVTSVEAKSQWRRLTLRLGEPAPGPHPTLRLPPHPRALLGRPAWWFHPFGVEAKRAEALRTVARHATRIDEWSALTSATAADKLALLPGIGVWTIGSVLGPAFGEPDAVAVGDFHIPNMVAWALAGEPRGSDERMLELLEPYRGQRGRVIRLLGRDGHAPPKFGPRQRIQPMYRY